MRRASLRPHGSLWPPLCCLIFSAKRSPARKNREEGGRFRELLLQHPTDARPTNAERLGDCCEPYPINANIPAFVIRSRTTSAVCPPTTTLSAVAVANPSRTKPASKSGVNPCSSATASVTPFCPASAIILSARDHSSPISQETIN